MNATVAKLVRHWSAKPEIVGSSPTRCSKGDAVDLKHIKDCLLNKPFDDAVTYLKLAKLKFRVKSKDGIGNCLTADYKSERINLTVNNNIITDLDNG